MKSKVYTPLIIKSMIDDEEQNSQPDNEEQVMIKDKNLDSLVMKDLIVDEQKDSQSDNPLFEAIDNLQFTNQQGLPFEPSIFEKVEKLKNSKTD
jgi:hypothetical protein